jgi:hypothetical protein
MICNGLRASPADYPGPLMADPRTIGPRLLATHYAGDDVTANLT